jgi:glyoxylase-like metal-dependent hydrolase (beta-lactamase superfamily II)
VIDASEIHRLRMGYGVIRVAKAPEFAGQRLQLCAYLIRHPRGVLLWDTGIGEHPEVERIYTPVRWPLEGQLAAHGLRLGDVTLVGNCHLHFDHAGGNAKFPGVPILAQRLEHEAAAAEEDYTIPGIADFPGAAYQLLDGDAPVWEGVTVVPSPGHTEGHQSLVVETRQGRVVLAGQSFTYASEFARARLSQELRHAGYEPDAEDDAFADYPSWMDVVQALDPWRVLFAHDVASWERGPGIPAQ